MSGGAAQSYRYDSRKVLGPVVGAADDLLSDFKGRERNAQQAVVEVQGLPFRGHLEVVDREYFIVSIASRAVTSTAHAGARSCVPHLR